MKNHKEQILDSAREIKGKLSEWRRHIHMNPELSGEEQATAKYVAEQLREIGITEIQENYAGICAVVAMIRGKTEQTVALRADMDALPITEKTGTEYCSKNEGVMHSCGHDAHTAMLLGAAKILFSLRDELPGSIKLIFQPAEERIDKDGARKLVEEGVLNKPKVSAIFGLHVFPEIPVGKVGSRMGQLMASCDIFQIKIRGKSAHAARPHLGVDPVLISAQAINSLHHIVSRKIDPISPAVLTIGKINGGFAENVIPDEVMMSGTVRTLCNNLRSKIPGLMEESLKGVTLAYGGDFSLEYQNGTAAVINNPETTEFAFAKMKDLLGSENVISLPEPSMGGEDFGEYLTAVPGTFIRVGVRNEEKKITAPLHSSFFDLDEDSLPVGASVLAYLAFEWLEIHD